MVGWFHKYAPTPVAPVAPAAPVQERRTSTITNQSRVCKCGALDALRLLQAVKVPHASISNETLDNEKLLSPFR